MVTSLPMLGTKSPYVEDAANSCARLLYIHSDKSIDFSEYQASLLKTPIPEHKTEVFGSSIQGAPFLYYWRPKCLLLLVGTPAIPSFQVKSFLHLSFWKRPDQPDSKWWWNHKNNIDQLNKLPLFYELQFVLEHLLRGLSQLLLLYQKGERTHTYRAPFVVL